MFKKCQLCGKITFTLLRKSTTCPQCGNRFSDVKSPETGRGKGKLILPQRVSKSFEDSLKEQRQQAFEGGIIAEHIFMIPWEKVFTHRPFDIPYYAALNDRACILVFFSARSVRREEVIGEVLQSRRPFALHMETFLKGSYPIIRCNFVFPDNPGDPLILESPLDIREGNVQDFCQAVLADEKIDIILKHELGSKDGCYTIGVLAPGLSAVVIREVDRAASNLKPNSSEADFNSTVRTMESVFSSAAAGVNPANTIKLTVIGEAQNKYIKQ
jgi:hypothetical protein